MTFTEARARRVLAELEITSCGTTTAWGSSGGGVPASKPPRSGDADAPHLRWRREFDNAANDIVLADLVDQAEAELETIRGHAVKDRPTGETEAQRIERMVRDEVGATPEDIATSTYRMSATLVRRHRVKYGRDPETGKPREDVSEDLRADRARAMKNAGASLRDIATTLGTNHMAVARWLRMTVKKEKAA